MKIGEIEAHFFFLFRRMRMNEGGGETHNENATRRLLLFLRPVSLLVCLSLPPTLGDWVNGWAVVEG